ncbi:uncharacterized protein LOC143276116 [Babylonia areolata]|uniref:uncharacterized protein LOC143276116 n=1 Tax=Babylonia areolata TaxID=304850 RepID=UPI003FD431D2
MDGPGILRRRAVITQPVEEGGTLAGTTFIAPTPFPNNTVSVTANEETDINIRKTQTRQPSVENGASALGIGQSSTSVYSEDEVVVDMQHTRQLQNYVSMRQPGLLEKDLSINVRMGQSSCDAAADDLADLDIVEEVEELSVNKKRPISHGTDEDIIQLLNEMPTKRGVICEEQKVLYCDDGVYTEGLQYDIIPGTQSKGAFGEAAMCQDRRTGKTFMRKTVKGTLSRNEVQVPIMFRGNVGIPQVHGVNMTDGVTEIFQEFAGLSLKSVMESGSDYTKQLCDPKMVMVLAFQAFATLHKLHSQGVTHQDIKPENLCLDIQPKGGWRLKFIDFGSSQTPKDQVLEGLTNEYLSPESCNTILQIATEKMPREAGRLGPGTDVWALALSLLYCLCGYHVMVYVCTGQTRYLEQDPAKLQHLRMQCLIKICNLKDEDIERKLILPDWPEALKTLLVNTLRVDPNNRWSAKEAAEHIFRNWILRGSGAQAQQQPAPAIAAASPPAMAPGNMFRGLTPSKIVVQIRPSAQKGTEERGGTVQPVQCSSPSAVAPPSPSSPASTLDVPPPSPGQLLSNTTTKNPKRHSRCKQRAEPYHQTARRPSKQ